MKEKKKLKKSNGSAYPRLCSMPIIQERPPREGHLPSVERMIIIMAKKWVNGTNLTYYFMDGTNAEKDAVRTGFQTWKNVGIGLTFEEKNRADDALIRIGFLEGDGSWSYVGRDLWNIPKHQRTMNFGWDIRNDQDTILHEIGHSLGLPHEHQNPNAGIVWNEPAVIADLSGPPNNWPISTIRHNVLDAKAADEIQGSALDEDSIMMYPMPGRWITAPPDLTDGIRPAPGLSAKDREWVQKFYPPLDEDDIIELELYRTEMVYIDPGEQVDFTFKAPWTGDFNFRTFGNMDTVMVIFEVDGNNELFLAGDDDSGTGLNSYIKVKLVKDRKYHIRLRLYYRWGEGNTSIMVY